MGVQPQLPPRNPTAHGLDRILRACRRGLAAVGLFLIGSATSQAGTLIPPDAEWKTFKGLSEASTPDPTAWRQRAFDDSAWQKLSAPFWYGDAQVSPGTELTDMQGNYCTFFVRRTFVINSPAALRELQLQVSCDDGFMAWINGRLVAWTNVAEGEPNYRSTALVPATEPVQFETYVVTNVQDFLVAGTNVLAVQGFNVSLGGSSDFVLNIALSSPTDDAPPVVVETIPAAGATVDELAHIEVIFDENVTGVDAADLLINGAPATGFEVYSPRDYLFRFPQPPLGAVQVTWAAAHGITDLADPPNAFGGGSWSLTLAVAPPETTVMISEFMADNEAGIKDDFGNRSDWIELLNVGVKPVDLEGWFLTDELAKLTKWRFPAVTINPNAYLLVWATKRNRTNPPAPLHTSFALSRESGYLGLVDPRTNVVSEFAPVYPPQRANISYGRDRANPLVTGYFLVPTPGAANSTTGPGFAPDPVFSIESGVYTNSSLSLVLTAPAGEVRYTLDGSVPTATSTLYTQPIVFSNSTVVYARVFQAGLLPSRVVVHTYNLAGSSLRDFSSNLPLLVINTRGRPIQNDSRIKAFLTAFEEHQGRAGWVNPPDYQGPVQIELRGQSSLGFPKQPFNLELNDAATNDVEVPLLGLPKESDWVLHNPYSDKCLMNNFLAFELHRQMGHYAPRCRFVELFVDSAGGRLDYPADYRGIYVLMEKIKIDKSRVDLQRLTPAHTNEPAITGGYIIKKDKDSPGDLNFSTSGGSGFQSQALKYHDPKPREITLAQKNWIRNYLIQFEKCLYAADWLTRKGTNHYSAYIDLDSFVDNQWIVEFTKQIDGYRLSNYMSKDRGGKLRMDPIWDWNLAFGNADYLEGWLTNGWYYTQLGDAEHPWLRRLMCGTASSSGTTGDPDFRQKLVDRWSVLRTNIFNPTNINARIDQIAAYLNEAQARDFQRWPRLNTYVWPNPGFYITGTYSNIIVAMKRWVTGRYFWMDGQSLPAPVLSHPGGPVADGLAVALSARTGTIYYTTDGSDPRLPGGALSPVAKVYSQPEVLHANARIFARARSGVNWSGPGAATFILATPPLVVTEIMYHPAPPPPGDTNDVENFEYVELKNVGARELDLAGFRFTQGIFYTFAPTSAVTRLAPGDYVLLVKNQGAFAARYPAVTNVAGEYAGSLSNAGERLALKGPLEEPILDFAFNDQWFPLADGHGFSLVIKNEAGPLSAWTERAAWRQSSELLGSPGRPDPAPAELPRVLVNEALTHTVLPQTDTVELYNPGDRLVDITGWFLSDDFREPKKFTLPTDTTIQAGGCLLLDESAFNRPGAGGFALSAFGDELYLFSGDGTNLTGFVHGFSFGAAPASRTFGRHLTSAGRERFVRQARPTLGEPNAGPLVGPLVLNEIMYNPPPQGTNNNTTDEFIELLNITAHAVALYDPAAPTNTWRLRGGVALDFPAGLMMASGDYLLVVNFNPTNEIARTNFIAKYGVPSGVRLVGPYQGHLENLGERIVLLEPGPPVPPPSADAGVVPYYVVDEVEYSNVPPWPPAADGSGLSLQRLAAADYGDDPVNWQAALPTAGSANPAVPQDADGDGLADAWEIVHFGSLSATPEADPDQDGMSNFQECLAGTDPNDPASYLRVEFVQATGGGARLWFHAVAGRTYTILCRDDLRTAPWVKLKDVPAPAVSGEVQVLDESARAARFYRLVTPQE